MLDSMPRVHAVFDVRQTFFEGSKTFLGLLFQLFEPVFEVFEVLSCPRSFHKFEMEVIEDLLCFQERVVVFNDQLDFCTLLAAVSCLFFENVQASLELVDARFGMD